MKITNISINNFKGIDSLKFTPKTINIMVGSNNTGKTSVLESIACAFIPEFIEENFGGTPAALINYLSESSEIEFRTVNERKMIHSVSISRLQPEEIITRKIEDLEEFFDQIKAREEMSRLTFMPKTKKEENNINQAIKSLTDERLRDLIDKALKTISVESISKVARECINVKVDGKKTTYSGKKYFITLILLYLSNFPLSMAKAALSLL